MFKDIISNEEVKKFLINELKNKKKQGTYIFYGEDTDLVMEFAISYAKALTCKEEIYDFCGVCESCKRMDSLSHGDLEIFEDTEKTNKGIKIDVVKDIIYRATTSSYEGGNRIFILKDSENMSKYTSNALLKILEEPKKGDFFILVATSLQNILPTIKSRSSIVRINLKTAEELSVSNEVYEFFLGRGPDIMAYKKIDVNLEMAESYKNIGNFVRDYRELTKENINKETRQKEIVEAKIKLYKSLRDFVSNKRYIKKIEKIKFAEEIYYNLSKDRKLAEEICTYLCHLIKDYDKLEKLLIIKDSLKHNVNLKLFLKVFINELGA